jgi:hypothetical protein
MTLTLSVTASRTVDAADVAVLGDALTALTETHETDSPIVADTGSLRWQDGDVWVQASLQTETDPERYTEAEESLAQAAVTTGLYDTTEAAKEAVDVSGA